MSKLSLLSQVDSLIYKFCRDKEKKSSIDRMKTVTSEFQNVFNTKKELRNVDVKELVFRRTILYL